MPSLQDVSIAALLYVHEFKSEWEFTPCDDQGVIRFGDAGAIQTGEMAQVADKGD